MHRHRTATADDPFATEVAEAASRFITEQKELVTARSQGQDGSVLVLRFEQGLLPLQRALEQSLDRLVEHKEGALEEIYAAAARERARLTTRLYALLALRAVVGIVVAWFFARRIALAYQAEKNSRDVAHRAVSSRDELMGMVAHDLRNPLDAIALKAAYLRERRNAPEAVCTEADSIENMTLRMSSLLDSMLDLTTIEAGRFSVAKEACAVDELLSDAADMFRNAARARGVRFLDPMLAPGLRVHADHERVLQVLSNLLGNALRHTPRGGEIALSVARSDDMTLFTVSDTGSGIPDEHLPNLFDRFFKADASRRCGRRASLSRQSIPLVTASHG